MLGVEVSIIIKAFNEENNIASSIKSALAAISELNGEIILADSLSTDRTIEIASNYPIKIVQIINQNDRRCGVGPQLGYQHAKGEFIYILDGDMELNREFFVLALSIIKKDIKLAGVAGFIVDKINTNFQSMRRIRHGALRLEHNWLDGGGLYRRTALESVGYLSNRNLHSFEEQDLGLRLLDNGWRLKQLSMPAASHHGYDMDTLALLVRQWKNGYLQGSGELIRASWGERFFWKTLAKQKHLIVALCMWGWLLAGLVLLPWLAEPLIVLPVIVTSVLILKYFRGNSLKYAALSIIIWQISSIGMLRGLITPQNDPRQRIDDIILKN